MTSHVVHTRARGNAAYMSPDFAPNEGRPIAAQQVRNLVSDLAAQLARPVVADSSTTTEQAGHLAQLGALMAIRAATDDLATAAATDAARCGAMYPAIAEAASTTRQNARVRWPGLATLARQARLAGPADPKVCTSPGSEEAQP